MSANFVNQVPYLRTSREFPEDTHQLTVEVNKSYVDIANNVNVRTIGLFPTTRPAINGEQWNVPNTTSGGTVWMTSGNRRLQGIRQVYTLTVSGGAFNTITHGINVDFPLQFTPKCYGSYTDGTSSYGLIFGSGSVTSIPGQISFYVTSTQIKFIVGSGAPTPTGGTVVLEWLSEP